MATLSERDKSLLQDQIDQLESNNKALLEAIDSDFIEINNLLLTDISSKKFVDEKHLKIYELEEELRLCTGKTVIGTVEEDAFKIFTDELNVKAYITDGRFIAKKNDIVIVDVPIIDSRAYILSSSAGPNFDIWTRDRHGSVTSQKNVPDSYTVHEGNNKITVVIDGVQKTIAIISPDILEVSDGSLTVDASTLASNLSLSLSENFEEAKCFFHVVNKCFTIVSGSIGTNSSAQVLVGTDIDDIARKMNFSTQISVIGRYANNKFTIAIDKVEKEIELTFDMRVPIASSLGQVIDDYSADWKTNFDDGPMFPADSNNGKKVATLIQNKLREIGEGGFKTAECMYFSSSNKFIISSGTFGETSSIEIKPNSDSDRDLAPYLGLLQPTDNKNNEKSYNTLQELFDYLNNKTVISCSDLQNPSFKSYSLLTMENGMLLSNIPYILQTTSEYDRASILEPRLYSGKLRIDSSNDKIDTSEGTRTLQHGDFSEGELCEIIQSTLNVGSTSFTVTYKKNTKTFEITSSVAVTLLFNTGSNKSKSIATYIGFLNTSDLAGTLFTGGPISFSGIDFFSMAEIPQLVPMSYFGNKPPYYYDSAVKSEQNLMTAELIFLNTEDNSGGMINNIKTQTNVYNESNIIALENALTEELKFVNNLINAIQLLMSNYSIISTTDSVYINLVTAINNAITAKNKIETCIAVHNYLLNLRSSSQTFIFGTAFTTGGEEHLNISFSQPNGDRLYNLTPIEFKYTDNKYIAMKNLDNIYDNNTAFEQFLQPAFNIKSNVSAISGYSVSSIDADGLFNITSLNNKLNVTIDGIAEIILLNLGANLTGYNVANDIESKLQIIGTGGFTNAKCYWNRFDCLNSFKIFSGTTGTLSTVEILDDVIDVNALNNEFYFEDSHTQVTNYLIGNGNSTTVSYSGTLNQRIVPFSVTFSATISGIVRTVTDNGSGILTGFVTGGTNTINYLTGSYNFTFAGNVDNGSAITVTYQYYTLKLATIANGYYNGSDFATAVQDALNSTSTGYSCAYSAITNKLTISSTNSYFNLCFGSASSSAAEILGFNELDKTGSLSYTSDNDVVLSAVSELNYSIQTTDTGHTITDTKITITNSFISSKVYWTVGNSEHFHYDFSTYANIKSLIDIISNDFSTEYDISIGKATLWSRKQEKFQINNGEQFQIKVNNGAVQSVNFNLTRAQLSSSGNQAVTVAGDTLIFSLNGEASRTITFPTPTSTGIETAEMIQSLVRSLIAINPDNQPAYSNFICTYSSNYTLICGIYGSSSSVNVSGGTLSSKLNLSGSGSGSGIISNNFAVTAAQLISVMTFSNATVSNDSSFVKIQADNSDEKIEIVSNSLSNRIGFYNENLSSDPSNEYTTVNCNSLINITDESILSDLLVNKGYENRGNIIATFDITDNIRLNNRLADIITRKNYLLTRQSQVTSRLSAINSALSIANYNDRWTEVIRRLNKKTGSYFKVGDKQLAIIRSQQSITENNSKIAELKAMLGE